MKLRNRSPPHRHPSRQPPPPSPPSDPFSSDHSIQSSPPSSDDDLSPASSSPEDILVVNKRKRKVQPPLRRHGRRISKSEAAFVDAGSLLRYAKPNVKNTNDVSIAPLIHLDNDGEEREEDDDDDDDDDAFQVPRSRSIAKKRENVEKVSRRAAAPKDRARRSVRVNYKEESNSDGSDLEEDNRGPYTVSVERPMSVHLHSQGGERSGEDFKQIAIVPDTSPEKSLDSEKVLVPGRRRLTKLVNRLGDRFSVRKSSGCEKVEDADRDFSKSIEESCLPGAGQEIPLRTYSRIRKSVKSFAEKQSGSKRPTAEGSIFNTNRASLQRTCAPKCLQEKPSDGDSCVSGELEFLANTYNRRARKGKEQTQVDSQTTEEESVGVKNKLDNQSADFDWPKLEVDVFGPISGEDKRPVVKQLGQVEKILSVKYRKTDSAVFCVKVCGKSYRNAVDVPERLLCRKFPQLLRNFLKKMDDLGRVDGNLGETEDSPAFSPLYIQIDRIVAAEQRGRRKYYLVKWRGLPYSEATWELDDHIGRDKEAIRRFVQINSMGPKGLAALPPNKKLEFKDGRALRDYQEEGLAWMDHNFQMHINCILADEMGLGKTMQSVAMLQNLRIKWKVRGPFLVIAPVSTLGHWQREVESLTDMNCVVYSGSMGDRATIREYEFYSPQNLNNLKFNVLLTSFEILMKDQSFLSKLKWQYIIVDEAHRLKTRDSKTTRTLKQMAVKKGGLLLLTGTPVQNNTKEIFSLLSLLDPEKFSSEEEFLLKYGDIKNAEQVRDLQENILKPRLLRRMKEDVEKSIPQKEETIIWVELTKEQRSYYRAIYENRISDLLKGSQSSNMPNLRNVAMELRKLCNHPFLCDGLEEDLIFKSSVLGDTSLDDKKKVELSQKALCQTSGKMLLLDKLLPMLKDAGRRVLIFSQFTILLDLLEDYLDLKGYSFERIDGKIRGYERQAAIDRYSARGSDTFIFLLSTRAGGLGITLTAADTCIIYDSDWNPQNDLQAMARCHRIGQTKDVRIYRLITRNTYEQHLFECSSLKYGLDEAILGNMLGPSGDSETSRNIESLLKRGAYDILKDDGEAEAAAFHAQNIDQILEQRTQKRLIGGRGNNTFSVATFISNADVESLCTEGRNLDPEMDSTQFWQGLLPEACRSVLNTEKQQEIPTGGLRRKAKVNYRERKEVSDEDTSDEEETKAEGKKRSSGNKRKYDVDTEDGVKQWSDRELKRLENRLVMLGRGRTEQIMAEAGLDHRGLVEVQQVADTLIQLCQEIELKEDASGACKVIKLGCPDEEMQDKCFHNSGVEWAPQPGDWISGMYKDGGQMLESRAENDRNESVKHIADSCSTGGVQAVGNEGDDNVISMFGVKLESPRIPLFALKAMSSQNFTTRLQKNASRYLQILYEREVLASALSDPTFSLPLLPRTKKLPTWWTKVEDMDLMIGASKHGHRDFSKIREDKSLGFAIRLNAKEVGLNCEIPSLEACGSSVVASDVIESKGTQDPGQMDDWPHDSVLASRLKKLIESLPKGLSEREIKKRAALSEAARKRAQDLRLIKQNRETAVPSLEKLGVLQKGFIDSKYSLPLQQFEVKATVYQDNLLQEHPEAKDLGYLSEVCEDKMMMIPVDNHRELPTNRECQIACPSVNNLEVLSKGTKNFVQTAERDLGIGGNAVQILDVDNTSSESEGDDSLRNTEMTPHNNQSSQSQASAASKSLLWSRTLKSSTHHSRPPITEEVLMMQQKGQDQISPTSSAAMDSITAIGKSDISTAVTMDLTGKLVENCSESLDTNSKGNDLLKRRTLSLALSASKRLKESVLDGSKQCTLLGFLTYKPSANWNDSF